MSNKSKPLNFYFHGSMSTYWCLIISFHFCLFRPPSSFFTIERLAFVCLFSWHIKSQLINNRIKNENLNNFPIIEKELFKKFGIFFPLISFENSKRWRSIRMTRHILWWCDAWLSVQSLFLTPVDFHHRHRLFSSSTTRSSAGENDNSNERCDVSGCTGWTK